MERAVTSERQTVSTHESLAPKQRTIGTQPRLRRPKILLVTRGGPRRPTGENPPSMSVVYPCLEAILSSSMRVPGAEGRSLPAGCATLEAWVRTGLPGVNSHVAKSSPRS